jgi:RHS repeat-associated protein
VQWSHKSDNHLESIEIDGEILTEYQRDALNREISKTQGLLQSTHEYDSLGRLIKQATNKQDKAQVLQRSYSYDKVGELLSIEDSRKGKFTYGYDKLGRVTHAKTPSKEETFTFDPAHNLIEKDDFHKHSNRIETYQDKRYAYDDFGNMQTKKISNHTQMEFEYNLEHQMTKAKVSKNNITQNYTYGYDAFGRRVSKTDDFGTTYFTWDGNRLLSEKRGTKEQTYIYEQDGFVPLATLDQVNNISYYHTDHLGTPQEMTNTDGDIVWEAEYTTWGNTAKVSYKQSTIKPENEVEFQPLRFQGQYYDKETGLHYNRFRYYDPDVGRFTTQDPIGLLGGDNLYAYAPNPTFWVDPLGLAGTGGAYMFEHSKSGSYIGKGESGRMNQSIIARKKGPKDCLLGKASISTGGDNDLGKMVEYAAMRDAKFTPGMGKAGITAGFSNAFVSGKSTYDIANPAKQAQADKLAKTLKAKFTADKVARKTKGLIKCK